MSVELRKRDLKSLTEALNSANGKATTRTLSVDESLNLLTDAESFLLKRCTKKALTGTTVCVHSTMEKLPKSYGYSANSTKATFMYDGKNWAFKEAKCDFLKQKGNGYHCEINLSDTAKDDIIAYHTVM